MELEEKWIAALRERAGGVLHRHGAHRPAVQGAIAIALERRVRHFRAGRAQQLVHASARPDEKHWHGASPTTAMTRIAIQEELNGKVVDWMERVTDDQYNARREE